MGALSDVVVRNRVSVPVYIERGKAAALQVGWSHERHWRLEVADCEVGLVGVGQLQIVEVAAWFAEIRPGVPGPMRQRNELVGRDAEGADIG